MIVNDGGSPKLEVDVAHLDNISTYLENLVYQIRQNTLPLLDDVDRLLTVGDSELDSTLGSPEIIEVGGRKGKGGGLANKATEAQTTVVAGLKDTAQSLENAAKAVKKIAERYKTTEERNASTAADFLAGAKDGKAM